MHEEIEVDDGIIDVSFSCMDVFDVFVCGVDDE